MRKTVFSGCVAAVAASTVLGSVAHGAVAARFGGSGYSAGLSSDPATRQQQLSCDPSGAELLSGSMSTTFDPTLVSFRDVQAVAPFTITSVYDDKNSQGQETGYLQVFFTRLSEDSDTDTVKNKGKGKGNSPAKDKDDKFHAGKNSGSTSSSTQDQITHLIDFNFIANPTSVATYTNFASTGLHGQPSDSLTMQDQQGIFTVPASQIAPATASAPLVASPVPEPASVVLLSTAGLVFGGLGLVSHRRRGRAAQASV